MPRGLQDARRVPQTFVEAGTLRRSGLVRVDAADKLTSQLASSGILRATPAVQGHFNQAKRLGSWSWSSIASGSPSPHPLTFARLEVHKHVSVPTLGPALCVLAGKAERKAWICLQDAGAAGITVALAARCYHNPGQKVERASSDCPRDLHHIPPPLSQLGRAPC